MSKFGRNELAVGFLVLGALALMGWMAMKLGTLRRVGQEVAVSALFDNVAGLSDGAYVDVAGVPVGRVASLEVDNGKARVHLALREDAHIRKDAIVRVRARSLLGEKYVELTAPSADAPLAQDGDVLAAGAPSVEIDELVTQMSPVVGAVDPAALAQLLNAISDVYKDDPERMKRVADDVETIVHNAALASADAPALVSEARQTMADVRQATREARPVIQRADAAIAKADQALDGAGPAMDDLQALLSDGRGAVGDGRALMSRLDGSMDKVQVVLDNLSEIDKWELRRIVREEGITVRLHPRKIEPDDGSDEK